MEFDIRRRDYLFKHTISECPEINAERFKEHFHTTYEILYFMRGDADFVCQHTQYNIIAGSLLIAKPGEYHNIIFHSQAPYERYVIRFNPFSIYPYMRKKLEKSNSVYQIAGTPLAELFFALDHHLSLVHKDVRFSVCIGHLQILIAYLTSSENLIKEADFTDLEAKRIVDYIDEHLQELHTAEELVNALHMSKSAIYKTFSKQFDTTLMAYIRTQKCIQARNMLNTGMPATEVSERLGFNHYSSFYRDYRQVFNESPSEMTKIVQ